MFRPFLKIIQTFKIINIKYSSRSAVPFDSLKDGLKIKLMDIASAEEIQNPKYIVHEDKEANTTVLGRILEVDVEGDSAVGKPKTLNLIVKTPNPDTKDVEMQRYQHDLYAREMLIYNYLFKNIDVMEKSRGVINKFSKYVPKPYKFSIDYLEEYAIFENLKPKGYKMADEKKSLDHYHCLLVMRNLSRFHALTYVMREWDNKLHFTHQELLKSIIPKSPKFRKTYEDDCMDAADLLDIKTELKSIMKFEPFARHFFDEFVDSNSRTTVNGVWCHGDCRTANLLFKYDDPAQPDIPTDMCFVDWQQARYASPTVDLSYFFYTSTDKRLRFTEMDMLLQLYYTSFNEVLREFGCHPQNILNKEYYKADLRRNFKYGLGLSCTALKYITSPDRELYKQRVCDNINEAVIRKLI